MPKNLQKFQKKIGHTFENEDHLKESLTHSSFAYEYQKGDIRDNEVMEFLGDSVLGFVVADFLCKKYGMVTHDRKNRYN